MATFMEILKDQNIISNLMNNNKDIRRIEAMIKNMEFEQF